MKLEAFWIAQVEECINHRERVLVPIEEMDQGPS